jgi:hypothetical protein
VTTARLIAIAMVAGGVAPLVAFGIVSLLTSAVSLEADIRLAVAAIAVPHLAGTAVGFWSMRAHVDRHVPLYFGIASAAGGLPGTLIHAWAGGTGLTAHFGVQFFLCDAGVG